MKPLTRSLAALAFCWLASIPASAQGHYLGGSLPIQAETSMPPFPGVYFSEIFLNYNGNAGLERSLLAGRVPTSLDLNLNVTAASSLLLWNTGEKFLGADYGVSIMLPFQNNSLGSALELGLLQNRQSRNSGVGLGDIFIAPLMLGWHSESADTLFSYGVYLPTGRWNPGALDNIGRGFATHQLQLGTSYYLDDERSWSLNAVGTFEANSSNSVMNPGNYFTFDWGILKKFDENWTVGVTGYNTRQLNAISGVRPGLLSNFTNSADAIGAEVRLTLPEADNLSMTLKFSHEYNSFGRFGGNIASLSFSIPIDMELPSAPPPASTPPPAPAAPAAPAAPPESTPAPESGQP